MCDLWGTQQMTPILIFGLDADLESGFAWTHNKSLQKK